MILAIIIVGLIAVIYAMDEKEKRAARQEAKKQAEEQAKKRKEEKERKEMEYEQEARRQIQEAASKIPGSVFYRELLSSLKDQIGTDVKRYLTWAYDEYMKTPGAAPEKFRTYLAKAYSEYEKLPLGDKKPGRFRPFPDSKRMTLTSVVYAVTPDGVYANPDRVCANPDDENHRVGFSMLQSCKFHFSCEKHGYSNLSQVQVWALAQTLCRDLGYKMTCYRESGNWLREYNFFICKEGYYRKHIEANPDKKYYIDLEPEGRTGYLAQVVESEIRRLQASNISYRSPF